MSRAGLALCLLPSLALAAAPADVLYRNGRIYTADAADSLQQSLAVRAGRLVYVGSDAGALALTGPKTRVVDLDGRAVMPGLMDGHMHPLEGGAELLKCNLDYEPLTVSQIQQRDPGCLDETRAAEPDGWLEVVSWFQAGMMPAGAPVYAGHARCAQDSAADRSRDSFGAHRARQFSRALRGAHITRDTPDPLGGAIEHDASGKPAESCRMPATSPWTPCCRR